jgi:hypothetical protein
MIPDIIKFFNGEGIPMFQNSGKIWSDYQKHLAEEEYEDRYHRGEVNGPIPNYDFKDRNTNSVFLPYFGFPESDYREQKQSKDYGYRNSSDSFYNDDFVYNRLNNPDNTPSHVFENDGKSNVRRMMFYYPEEQKVQNDTIIERNGTVFRRQNLSKEDWERINKYMDSRRMDSFLK